MSDLHAKLAARLGPKGWTADQELIAPHLAEQRGRLVGESPFLAMPASTEEVGAAVRLCAEAGVAITPQGGNTGLVGGQIPQGEILLSLKRMNRIRAVDPVDDSLIAEAGVALVRVQEAATEVDRLFPLSLGSQGSATIGGLLSTNAGGVHVIRYGMMRDLTLGIEAVLPDGSVLSSLSSLRKNNTGYDLKQLFIGAEGTLGIITAATLKLFPRPAAHVTAVAAVKDPAAALDLLHRAKAAGPLAAFELMNRTAIAVTVKNIPGARDPLAGDYVCLIEFEGEEAPLRAAMESLLERAMADGLVADAAIALSEAQAKAFWFVREEMGPGHRPEGRQVSCDISVPVSRVPDFIAQAPAAAERLCPGVRIVAFGHVGDGNIHFTMLQPAGPPMEAFPREALQAAAHDCAVKLGGSISAEHGVGRFRREELPRFKSPEALALMRTLKAALDPKRIMNPRVLI
ncbi:MAG: FAD-binding oxidoreductase [Hyphomonadaceae bacterium]|nr:FAD-binding oxidoreductase [Hyphomonadaceae bacterium]